MFFNWHLLIEYSKPYLSFIKKTIIVCFTFFIVISLFIYFNDSGKGEYKPQKNESREQFYKMINDPTYTKNKETEGAVALLQVLMCGSIGEGCSDNPNDAINNVDKSIAGRATSLVAMPFANMPASGIYWAHSTMQQAGFVSNTYAAGGIGFAALEPFKSLWLMFRNMILFLYVLIVIAIGFMIMFRTKINAQTVISIENALPKIVISMLLITFSYAIAGFMIDIMYISIGIMFVVFEKGQPFMQHGIERLKDQAYYGGSQALGGVFFDNENNVWGTAFGIYRFIPGQVTAILDPIVTEFVGWKLFSMVGGQIIGNAAVPFSTAAAGGTKATAAMDKFIKFLSKPAWLNNLLKEGSNTKTPVVSIIIFLILFIFHEVLDKTLGVVFLTIVIWLLLMLGLLFIFARVFFMFLNAYIQILLAVILAPLQLSLEAIPGRSSFADWFKGLFFNLLTFPLFVGIVLIVRSIMFTPADDQFASNLWQPPFIGGVDPEAFRTIIAGILLFSIPNLINQAKQMLGYKPGPNLANPGALMIGATTLFTGGFGIANQIQSLRSTLWGHTAGGLLGEKGAPKSGPLNTIRNLLGMSPP